MDTMMSSSQTLSVPVFIKLGVVNTPSEPGQVVVEVEAAAQPPVTVETAPS
jgi:hypothetical protein